MTAMSDSRKEFEAFAASVGHRLIPSSNPYADYAAPESNVAWEFWQAARSSPSIRQAALKEHDKGPWTLGDQEGHLLYSDDFEHDVTLKIVGDFLPEDRLAYAKTLCDVLNEASGASAGMQEAE